ncbi:MAG: NYN domain-containing protein [Chloroflexota bacterium]|nr:NYN domain-containing protein [Chloroflexota bacterium]
MADERMAGGGQAAGGGQGTDGKTRKSSRIALWWKRFWMWRLGPRMVGALALALLALLALDYLLSSAADQAQWLATGRSFMQLVSQSLSATNMRWTMLGVLAIGVGACVALLLWPVSPKSLYRYLFPPTSVSSYTTVMLDIENLADNQDFAFIFGNLLKRIASLRSKTERRRIDLLVFMDAKHLKPDQGTQFKPTHVTAQVWQENLNRAYAPLISSGFRLINAPHNPSGVRRLKDVSYLEDRPNMRIKEAADREMEFLAFERALLSRRRQTFILVSGDGDFAPLIYSLIALGHEAKVWMWGKTRVYSGMSEAIPNLDVAKLSPPDQAQTIRTDTVASETLAPTKVSETTAPADSAFSQPAMNDLYRAIHSTVELCLVTTGSQGTWEEKRTRLYSLLGNKNMRPMLLQLGFTDRHASVSWVRTLSAVGAVGPGTGGVPSRGTLNAEDAARRLQAMALAIARAAASAQRDLNSDVSFEAIKAQLRKIAVTSDVAEMLQSVVFKSDTANLDTYNLTLCAGKLDLLTFTNPDRKSRLIRSPRLTVRAERIIAEQSGGQPEPPVAPEPPEPPSL